MTIKDLIYAIATWFMWLTFVLILVIWFDMLGIMWLLIIPFILRVVNVAFNEYKSKNEEE